jgi:hypothetical protein
MAATYLILLLIALIIFNWRFLGLDRLFRRDPKKKCRWRLIADAKDGFPTQWRCNACGVEVGTKDGKEPVRCVRMARELL